MELIHSVGVLLVDVVAWGLFFWKEEDVRLQLVKRRTKKQQATYNTVVVWGQHYFICIHKYRILRTIRGTLIFKQFLKKTFFTIFVIRLQSQTKKILCL